MVEAGEVIPGDGEVIEGIASVDESAITGESAPVIREAGGDRSAVTGGTKVLSDWIRVRISAEPGKSFLDRMIALVEGAERQKTPKRDRSVDPAQRAHHHLPDRGGHPAAVRDVLRTPRVVVVLIALLVCLIPTGTITLGNRQATAFLPLSGVETEELADAAQLSSLSDETPEGRSVVVLAKERYNLRGRELLERHAQFVPFSAYTRMSGADLDGRSIRKGAAEAVVKWVREQGGKIPPELDPMVDRIAREGGTPLVVASNDRVLGVIQLKDIVKGGMRDRFDQLRRMGIRTVMITGDNPLTAAAIANDVAKYFAIIPALFAATYPVLDRLNLLRLQTPESAVLSAVIFNALVIIALVPLALRGVRFRAVSATALLRRNLLVYGLGGIVIPFIGIKLVDLVVTRSTSPDQEACIPCLSTCAAA